MIGQHGDVFPALMYAPPEETERRCRAASDSLGLGKPEVDDVWARRQDLHDVFMEHFCALTRSQRCAECGQQDSEAVECVRSCSSDDRRLVESGSIYDAWYS